MASKYAGSRNYSGSESTLRIVFLLGDQSHQYLINRHGPGQDNKLAAPSRLKELHFRRHQSEILDASNFIHINSKAHATIRLPKLRNSGDLGAWISSLI